MNRDSFIRSSALTEGGGVAIPGPCQRDGILGFRSFVNCVWHKKLLISFIFMSH